MIIKQPNDDNAIRALMRILNWLDGTRLSLDDVLVIYMSTLLMTPGVAYRDAQTGIRVTLLDALKRILNKSSGNVICVLRTTAPSCFRGRMRKLHQKALDSLRDKCYVKVYDKNLFLNHAKFLIYCYFSLEQKELIYFRTARYFGSTNFTTAGLSNKSGTKKGNYEEFTVWERSEERLWGWRYIRSRRYLREMYYLREIMSIMKENYGLYMENIYLENYLNEHIKYLRDIVSSAKGIVSGTTLGELYEAFIDCQVAYLQTLAFLDAIPGKNLTRKIIAELEDIMTPPNPFEIEIMIPYDTEHAQRLAETLELDKELLISWIKDGINVINKAISLLDEEYRKEIPRIREHFDEQERKLADFLSIKTENYMNFLRMLIENLNRP